MHGATRRSEPAPTKARLDDCPIACPREAAAVLSPSSGVITLRRIVKNKKRSSFRTTQLVQLDGGASTIGGRYHSSHLSNSLATDASISDIRSELGSPIVDEITDASFSSFFDNKGLRAPVARRSSLGSVRPSARRHSSSSTHGVTKSGSILNPRSRKLCQNTSLLSYSGSSSSYSEDFFSASSRSSSRSSASYDSPSEEKSRSIVSATMSESVPSCSLTVIGDVNVRTGRARLMRAPQPQLHRDSSNSFSSLFANAAIAIYYDKGPSGHPGGCRAAFLAGVPGLPLTDGRQTISGPSLQQTGNTSSDGHRVSLPSQIMMDPFVNSQNKEGSAEGGGQVMANGNLCGTSATGPGAASTRNYCAVPRDNQLETSISLIDHGVKLLKKPRVTISEEFTDAKLTDMKGSKEERNSTTEGNTVRTARKEERIGRGSYGDVYRGVDVDTGRVLAIKEIIVPKDFTKDLEKQIATLEREIHVMRKLHHPNIINYLGAEREDNCIQIYMEYVSGGTIGYELKSNGAFSEELSKVYTWQLLSGLEYLHHRHIVHRDLKGDNLFLTEDGVLKVGDFGTSKELATTLVTDSVAGTPNFMAPEVITCSGHSYEADIWSVGCCVLEMLTGLPPFSKMDNHMAVMFAVMKGKLEEQVPDNISDKAKDFINVCTRVDPKVRWNVHQLREHPWLASVAQGASSLPQTHTEEVGMVFPAGSAAVPKCPRKGNETKLPTNIAAALPSSLATQSNNSPGEGSIPRPPRRPETELGASAHAGALGEVASNSEGNLCSIEVGASSSIMGKFPTLSGKRGSRNHEEDAHVTSTVPLRSMPKVRDHALTRAAAKPLSVLDLHDAPEFPIRPPSDPHGAKPSPRRERLLLGGPNTAPCRKETHNCGSHKTTSKFAERSTSKDDKKRYAPGKKTVPSGVSEIRLATTARTLDLPENGRRLPSFFTPRLSRDRE